tara:strand:+ start:128 stop:1015 length:888 start_codon:yes stop_codon:yes gene_type:complete
MEQTNIELDRYLDVNYGITRATRDHDDDYLNTPVWTTKLPESVFSAAMISPLWITVKPGCNFESILGMGMMWIFAILSFLIQATCVYFVQEMTRNKTSCSNASTLLTLISLLCFSSLIWVDIFETFKMGSYLYMLPKAKTIDGELVKSIKFDYAGNGVGFLDSNKSGVSRLYKKSVIAIILIPKWAIACSLWYYGCKFILMSDSNEAVLLNSVSLNFLLDIDDYLYKALISDYVKTTIIEDWPSLTYTRADLDLPKDHIEASCKNRYGFWSAWSQVLLPFIIGGLCSIAELAICG